MSNEPHNADELADLFAACGGTDLDYLRFHFPRHADTKRRVLAGWTRTNGTRVLDVGAHWLHQAVLYATDGFEVSALDLPLTLGADNVRAVADAHAIRLLPNVDLEHPSALREIEDDHFDLVLVTEVIEHLAFNPVALWREIYRVMRPGARLIVTTPNCYALRTTVRRWLRAVRGLGSGIAVSDILMLKTLGHHWKEYSRAELREYFMLLSVDFACTQARLVHVPLPQRPARLRDHAASLLERIVPVLRPGIHVEIDLPVKKHGIAIEPHW
ncbi:MAG TPA: methyltransferase domain-containing protein [Rudaea sp.]